MEGNVHEVDILKACIHKPSRIHYIREMIEVGSVDPRNQLIRHFFLDLGPRGSILKSAR